MQIAFALDYGGQDNTLAATDAAVELAALLKGGEADSPNKNVGACPEPRKTITTSSY